MVESDLVRMKGVPDSRLLRSYDIDELLPENYILASTGKNMKQNGPNLAVISDTMSQKFQQSVKVSPRF